MLNLSPRATGGGANTRACQWVPAPHGGGLRPDSGSVYEAPRPLEVGAGLGPGATGCCSLGSLALRSQDHSSYYLQAFK